MDRLKFITFFLIILIVVEVFVLHPASKKPSLASSECKNKQETSKKYQCWEELMISTLSKQGIKEAFLVFDDLYVREPEFASSCHSYAHLLGQETYKLLISGREFDFPPQTAFCGYGFYHGLTEALLQQKGPKETGKLCDSKKSQITQVLIDACYHGIGHGALSQTAQDKKVWGNAQKMINMALKTCQDSTDDSVEQSRCASGVFMELGNHFSEGKLDIKAIKNDPLAICRAQGDFGKMDCYTQMQGVLNTISEGKLSKSAKFVEDIKEDQYAIEAITTLAAPTIDITKSDFTSDISTCRQLQERLRLPCIKGLVLGFMLKGKPGVEYEQAINFCNGNHLLEEEKRACFDLVLRHSKDMYKKEEMAIICSRVEARFRADSACL